MKDYKVLSPVKLFHGKIRLTDSQAAPRGHCLRKAGDGVYEILGEVAFKQGETIGLESVSKATGHCLAEVSDRKK